MDVDAIRKATNGFPISFNDTCRLLHKNKDKLRPLIGNRIGLVNKVNNRYNCNLADVLDLVGKNI